MDDESLPVRRIFAIVNPAAGGGRAVPRFAALARRLMARGIEVDNVVSAAPGDAELLAAEAARSGEPIVAAVGGDGTAHEVANGLLAVGNPATAMTILPVGTGCDFARNLGMVRRREPAFDWEIRCDLGRVRFLEAGTGERYFLNAANMGASTRSAQRVGDSDFLRRSGSAAYILGGLPEILRRPTISLRIESEQVADAVELLNISVCNGPRFGGGLALAPEASLTDGSLHVASLAPMSIVGLVRALAKGFSASTGSRPGVELFSTARVVVRGSGAIEVDGEVPGMLPAEFTIVRGALRVIV